VGEGRREGGREGGRGEGRKDKIGWMLLYELSIIVRISQIPKDRLIRTQRMVSPEQHVQCLLAIHNEGSATKGLHPPVPFGNEAILSPGAHNVRVEGKARACNDHEKIKI